MSSNSINFFIVLERLDSTSGRGTAPLENIILLPVCENLNGTYNKEDDLYYFLLQQWNKDSQEYELVKSITVERFELNEQQTVEEFEEEELQ